MRLGEPWQDVACIFLYLLLLTFPDCRKASESPDRDCCEPLYPFITRSPTSYDSSVTTFFPTLYPEFPPEIPDNIIEIRRRQKLKRLKTTTTTTTSTTTTTTTITTTTTTTSKRTTTITTTTTTTTTITATQKSIFISTKSTSGSLNCLLARQLCSEDSACSQILEIIPKVCGVELVACSTVTVTKCQAAIRTLQGFPFFSPTCLCKEPHLDQKCSLFRRFLFDHPCGVVRTKESDPYPIDALPTCTHAYNVCQHSKPCIQIFNDFQETCAVENSNCVMKSWNDCRSAWSKLHLSPMFGCICPNDFHVEKYRCSEIFTVVNNNSCIGPHDDDNKVQLQSTCHLALTECELNGACNRFLDKLKRSCDSSLTCDKNKCMVAIQDFYRNIPQKYSLDVAFCLCKNTPSPDEQCLRAQSILHPTCAQNPTSEKQPACHDITRTCQSNPDCGRRLERFDQSCSVDGPTRSCAGPPDACRRAMIDILGTELRTNCNCEGTADFRELYECIGWHRLLWVNPCVVEAQKNYHRLKGNLDNESLGPTIYDHTAIPYYTTRSYYNTPIETKGTSYVKTTRTPLRPTKPPIYPTPPWPSRYTTRKTTFRTTTTTTTTTTLPPKFCLFERPGQPVKYIREGYEKRLYNIEDPECSELCECSEGEELLCKVLDCIKRDPCNTGVAFYSHASPFYQAYRGHCLCYSGSFVCSKPPKEVELVLPPGIYLFIGFSSKDESILQKITGAGAIEAIGAIQGLVSYHNVNSNKSECRIILQTRSVENLVLQAVMDEFEENREKKNVTAEILHREKEECFEALQSISYKINNNDADMRSHVILSMVKVAAAEADIPELPVSGSSNFSPVFLSVIASAIVCVPLE